MRLPLVFAFCVCASTNAFARNSRYVLPASDLSGRALTARLDPSILLRFGAQAFPDGEPRGEATVRGKGRGRSTLHTPDEDLDMCREAFANALADLQNKARSLGADTVANITSPDPGGDAPEGQYVCHAGTGGAHVQLRARFVRAKRLPTP